MDERDSFNATNPCLARPDPHRRASLHREALVVRRNPLRRLIAKLARWMPA
jgi:hypothetical protein